MSSGQYRCNTIRGVMDYFYRDGNLPNEASSRCIRPISRTGQPVASQGEIDIQYGIWIVYEKWAGNEPRILGRCLQTHDTPGERCGWSARGTRWVCDLRQQTRETGGGNWGHESTKLVDSSTVKTRKYY